MRVCTVCHEQVPPGMPVCPRDGGAAEDPDEGAERTIGSMVGEYRVKGLIGEGGMGQVYEGYQPVIGKRVAIKLLRRELATDKDEAQRLLGEARAVNAIGHRGIIDIFSFGALPDGRQYFVMEYLSGTSLSAHLKRHGALPLADTLRILDEVLAALGAAHLAGVIHRDLKPSNIFLVSQSGGTAFVKLLDFGIAKQAAAARSETPQTRVSRVMGTPEFMAPEQARGKPVGPRTDLYALGVIAFELLTGQLPFTAETPYEIVNLHLNARPPVPSSLVRDLPPELDALVLRLLEKSPADRPESAEAVRDELKKLRRTLDLHATQFVIAPNSMTHVVPNPVDGDDPAAIAAARAAVTRDAAAPRARETRAAPPNDEHTVHEVYTRDVSPISGPVTREASPDDEHTLAEVRRRDLSRESGPLTRGESARDEQTAADVVNESGPLPRVVGAPEHDPTTLRTTPRRTGWPWGVAVAVVVVGGTLAVVSWKRDEPVTPLVVESPLPPARIELTPPPVSPEPEATPAPTTAPDRPTGAPPSVTPEPEPKRTRAKPDALSNRYKRVQAAWARARTSRSAEDQRLFDVMLAGVGKQLTGGGRAEATEGLNDFVRGALDGKEP